MKTTSTPPRGWNSFDAYGLHLHEQAALANLRIMAERLARAGYTYFAIDGGWYNEYELIPGSLSPARREAVGRHLDGNGRYLPSYTYFPNGLRSIFDRVHELGLKAGLHIMRGIPREAFDRNLPVAGTSLTATDITDPSSVCHWSDANYGIDMTKPGAQTYYDGWIGMLAEWGVDFLKADDVTGHPAEIAAIAAAIERCGRPIVLSLSPGGDTDRRHIAAYDRADMVRVTRDVWDNREDIDAAFVAWREWAGEDRFWIDLDMLPLGSLLVPFGRATGGANSALHGRGGARRSQLTAPQQRTVVTMRALACSPLFLGSDLPTTDDEVFALVTNPDMLACSDNAVSATPTGTTGTVEVWRTGTADGSTSWVGAFNRGTAPVDVRLTPDVIADDQWDAVEAWTGDLVCRRPGAEPPMVRISADDVAFLRCQSSS